LITTGSKLYFALFGLGLVAAVVYGVVTNGIDHGGIIAQIQSDGSLNALIGPLTFGYKGGVGDHVGYSILMGFAICNLGLGIGTSAFRDADPEALAQLAGTDVVPAIQPPVGLNAWPFVGALAAVAVIVGLATSWILFTIGCVVAAIAAVEWTVSNWAEQATADASVNRRVRNRLMLPIEIPVGGTILVLAIVYCISRILLSVSKDGAWIIAALLALAIFGIAVAMSTRPQLRRSLVVGVLFVGALVILGVGIVGAVAGPREIEEHHSESHEGAAPAPHPVGQEG
jgi:hypothetical protein